jgi:hypothetical protein
VRSVRKRFWIESGCAVLSGLLGLLTLVWPDWIEELTGWNPDQRGGAAEWLIVALLAVVAAGSALLARVEWRRSIAAG